VPQGVANFGIGALVGNLGLDQLGEQRERFLVFVVVDMLARPLGWPVATHERQHGNNATMVIGAWNGAEELC
jgi:hypothetical protein